MCEGKQVGHWHVPRCPSSLLLSAAAATARPEGSIWPCKGDTGCPPFPPGPPCRSPMWRLRRRTCLLSRPWKSLLARIAGGLENAPLTSLENLPPIQMGCRGIGGPYLQETSQKGGGDLGATQGTCCSLVWSDKLRETLGSLLPEGHIGAKLPLPWQRKCSSLGTHSPQCRDPLSWQELVLPKLTRRKRDTP